MKVNCELYHVRYTGGSGYEKTKEEFLKNQEKYKAVSFLELTDYDESESYTRKYLADTELVLTKEELLELTLAGLMPKFEVIRRIENNVDITQQLIDVAEKPIKLIQETSNGDTYNNKCEVHMPGNAMALYNELLLREDSCTDEIQAALNAGWRLLAVCPQPDSRRPDYILGRFNPDFECAGSAKRVY